MSKTFKTFASEKNKELACQKYYWPTLQADIEVYVKRHDICISLKAIKHKLYGNL